MKRLQTRMVLEWDFEHDDRLYADDSPEQDFQIQEESDAVKDYVFEAVQDGYGFGTFEIYLSDRTVRGTWKKTLELPNKEDN